MKQFEFRIFQECTNYWEGTGIIEADDEEKARFNLINEDFECDKWECGENDVMTVAQHNGDKLLECLKTILKISKEEQVKLLIEKTIKEMTPIISIDSLIELK